MTYVWNFGDGSTTVTGATVSRTYADNGTYTVTLTVSDEDGGSASTTQTIVVANVAPTPEIASISATRIEGTSINFVGSATDPAGANDTLTYVWNFGDGSPTVTGATVSRTYADNGTYTVTLTVSDEDGGSASTTQTVVVANIAPTGVIANNGPVTAGSPVTVSISSSFDPSGLDLSAGLRYSFASTSTGLAATYASAGSSASASFTFQTSGNQTIFGRIFDKDGGFSDYSTTVTVNPNATNQRPVAGIVAPVDGVQNISSFFTLSATDPDLQDRTGTFTYVINWGDGSPVQTVTGPATMQVAHTFHKVSAQGVFTILATVTDPRGLQSSTAAKAEFGVLGWSIMIDPTNSAKCILVVVGSQGSDNIKIKDKDNDKYKIKIRDLEEQVQYKGTIYGDVHRVLIFGLGGDDDITFDDDIEVGASIWAGMGNDKIKGGEGDDIIYGEAGNDILFGGKGRDILIGGTGADKIHGDQHDDIIVAGYTAYDMEFNLLAPTNQTARKLDFTTQRIALESILNEWTSSRNYNDRRNNILGVSNSTYNQRRNGNYFLRSNTSAALDTVFDDNDKDTLWGDSGVDWFFANIGNESGTVQDELKDSTNGESKSDIDRWW